MDVSIQEDIELEEPLLNSQKKTIEFMGTRVDITTVGDEKMVNAHYLTILDKLGIFLETSFYLIIVLTFIISITIIYNSVPIIQTWWKAITLNAIYIWIVLIINIIISLIVFLSTIFAKYNMIQRRVWIVIWILSICLICIAIPPITHQVRIYVITGIAGLWYIALWIGGSFVFYKWDLSINQSKLDITRLLFIFILFSFLFVNIAQFVFTESIFNFVSTNVIPVFISLLAIILSIIEIGDIMNVHYYEHEEDKKMYMLNRVYNLISIFLNSNIIILIGVSFFVPRTSTKISWLGISPSGKYGNNTNKNNNNNNKNDDDYDDDDYDDNF